MRPFFLPSIQSCMSQAVTIGALTGEFPREQAARRRNDAMLLAVHRSDARAFPLSSSMLCRQIYGAVADGPVTTNGDCYGLPDFRTF